MKNPVNPVHPVQNSGLSDYDALGHRVRKIDAIAGTTTLYYNDPEWRVLAEYDAANNQLRKFIYGNYLDETLRMTDTYAGDNTPTGDYYFLQDHLYSPAVLLSSAGAVLERYEFDAYGTRHVFDQNFGTRANTNYGVYVAFQGHNHDCLDNDNLNLLDARYRTYDPFAGRWLMHEKLGMIPGFSQDAFRFSPTIQYSAGNNMYLCLLGNPVSFFDPMGLWGSDIHYQETSNWAEMVGYPQSAAFWVGSYDNHVDSMQNGTAPVPWQDLSYHFNRNSPGQEDSRITHYNEHTQYAKNMCMPNIDDPMQAAEQLGTALHPYQDWVAHGDYFIGQQITYIHNSHSPQREFGNPSKYPDNPYLDAIGSPDGRPAGNALLIISETVIPYPGIGGPPQQPVTVWYEYAMYGPGIHRLLMTEQMTKRSLYKFREWVRMYGGCKCKKFFGITSQ
ncbi:MAG: hypothetical protein GX455_02340 [Phycisphaerae bacterium]|nr:hypothetical protein [Phycisphaerae bacterium]